MALYIPDDKITAIRNTADIVDIISEVVQLKKAGKNYLGLCPFHSEKTPSFSVSPEKQIFHCFGCNEGGNVFTFLMKYQGVTFPEALRILARRYNIELPRQQSGSGNKKDVSEKEQLRKVNQQAASFFHARLKDAHDGRRARHYLASRGITEELMETFQLGFAPAGWDNLLDYFKGRRVSPKLLERAGLVVAKQAGGYYDRFRDRIMFPITDMAGDVIGFGGRVMDDALPKYLNSPETPLYNKSRSLYGLGQARHHCRAEKTVYLTEGYMDFLALYRCGIKNVVATLGTSLTVEQVRLLKGQVEQAILLFDSDAAGVKAAQRSVSIFNREKGLKLFILTLPDGHDPDSYLQEYGVEAFTRLSKTARGAMEFLIESAVREHGLSVEGKLRVAADMQEHLAAMEDAVARALYIKILAERIGIDERAVQERVNRVVSGQRRSVQDNGQPDSGRHAGRRNDCRQDRLEIRIIAMMLHAPVLLPDIEARSVLSFFENRTLKQIGGIILGKQHWIKDHGRELTDLAEDDEQRRIITSLLMENDSTDWEETGCRKLLDQFLNSRRGQDDLSRRIKDAEEQKNDDLLDHLLKEKQAQARARATTN